MTTRRFFSTWAMAVLILIGVFLVAVSAVARPAHAGPDIRFVEGFIGQVPVDVAYVDGSPAEALSALGAVSKADYALTGNKFTINPADFEHNQANAKLTDTQVQEALGLWNGYSTALTLVLAGDTTLPASLCATGTADTHRVIDWGVLPGDVIGVSCWNGNNECDIRLDTSFEGSIEAWKTVLAHEAGHCLGLGHSAVIDALMYPSYHGQTGPVGDDIAGLCAIYGCAASPTNTPTLTPTSTASPTVATPTATNTATSTPTSSPTATPTATPVPQGPWLLRAGKNSTPAFYAAFQAPCKPQAIYGWVEASQTWQIWFADFPAAFSDLTYMYSENGYWLYCPAAAVGR